jgi:exopolysaccharide biosynthesis operon protein EpsL
LAEGAGHAPVARRARRSGAGACALCGALLLSSTAAAQDRLLTPRLGTTVSWETNVFRVPDSVTDPQAARGVFGRSDRVQTSYVGLRLDKAYSQQRFVVDVTQTATRFGKFASLDRDALQYEAEWQWHVTPRISGRLSATRTESLISFDDVQQAQEIVRVTTNRAATLDAWLFGGWHLLAGASQVVTQSSQPFIAQPDTRQTGGEIGIRYLAASQNTVAAIARLQRGVRPGQPVDFVNFIDSGFSSTEYELSATWAATGHSTLTGRLTRLARRHENVGARDFSELTGEARYAWSPTARLSVNLTANRSVVPFTSGLSSSYRVDDTLSVTPAWRVSERVSLSLSGSRRASDFRGPVAGFSGPARHDVYRTLEFGANWTPHRAATLGFTVRRERRASTDDAASYRNNVAIVNVALTF